MKARSGERTQRLNSFGAPSPADPELFGQGPVPPRIFLFQILQKTAALADELQQAPPGVMIFHVEFEVIGETVDALREQRDLHFWRAGVPFVESNLFDEAFLPLTGDGHRETPPGASPLIAAPRSPSPGAGSNPARLPTNPAIHPSTGGAGSKGEI